MAKNDLFTSRGMSGAVRKDPAAVKERPRTVFGVYGLTEWETLVPAGRAKLRVRFTGGSLSGYGVVPATFTTYNMHIKLLIENSPQFNSGRIKRLA